MHHVEEHNVCGVVEIEKFDTAAAEMHGEIAFGRSSDVTATARSDCF